MPPYPRLIVSAIVALAVASACKGPAAPSTAPGAAGFSPNFSAPISFAQIDQTASMTIWPFGVQAGDHPNGHPGIDFFLIVGANVLADAAGTISDISNSYYAGEVGINIRHADGYTTYITGYFESIKVTKGQAVTQGQVIATAARWGTTTTGPASFHWGIVDASQKAYCPADFVPADVRAQMQALLDQSSFPEKPQFPLLCNACPAGGCR